MLPVVTRVKPVWSGVVQNRGFGYFGSAGRQTVRHCADLTVSARRIGTNKLCGKSPVSPETGDFLYLFRRDTPPGVSGIALGSRTPQERCPYGNMFYNVGNGYDRSPTQNPKAPGALRRGVVQWSRKYFTRSMKPSFFQLPQSSLGMSMTYFSQTLMTWVPWYSRSRWKVMP